jgi:hypothetical protein
MNAHRMRVICLGCVGGFLSWATTLVTPALSANSFSNSLTGFTGDSTVPATQAAVGAAGFNFASTAGLDPEFTMDPTVAFGSNGATFGLLFGGDGGRNYMRTNDSDYATVDFVAEITFESTDLVGQEVFIGLGSGEIALFGVPDWSNSVARTMTYSIDTNYAGGPFTADVTAPTTDLNHIDCPTGCGNPEMPISADFFAADGWPGEPSRIFFGGDDGVVFRDFTVTASAPPGLFGDFNDDGSVDAADYVMWRKNDGTNNALPNDNGLGTPIGALHYNLWRTNFGETSGGGAGGNSTGVPEPASLALIVLGVFAGSVVTRRQTVV